MKKISNYPVCFVVSVKGARRCRFSSCIKAIKLKGNYLSKESDILTKISHQSPEKEESLENIPQLGRVRIVLD